MRRPADGWATKRFSSRDPDSFRRALMPDGRATRLGRPPGRRARGVGRGYSGHPGVGVQLQLTAECVAIGCCGVIGPGEGPTVIGPSVSAFVGAMKPDPARLQPSPFMSMNEPVAPAVVGCACRTSWLTSSSPSSYVEPFAQVPTGLWPSVQVVDS